MKINNFFKKYISIANTALLIHSGFIEIIFGVPIFSKNLSYLRSPFLAMD